MKKYLDFYTPCMLNLFWKIEGMRPLIYCVPPGENKKIYLEWWKPIDDNGICVWEERKSSEPPPAQ